MGLPPQPPPVLELQTKIDAYNAADPWFLWNDDKIPPYTNHPWYIDSGFINLSDERRVDLLQMSFDRIYYFSGYSLKRRTEITDNQEWFLLRRLQWEYTLSLARHTSGEHTFTGLANRDVSEAGIVKEKYRSPWSPVPKWVTDVLDDHGFQLTSEAYQFYAGTLDIIRDDTK